MSDPAEGVVRALDNIRSDVVAEPTYDGDEYLEQTGLLFNVPPWKNARQKKCKNCGRIIWENMSYHNSCEYCR